MLPVLNLGPLSVPVPEFALLLGFWMGSFIAERKARSFLDDPGIIDRILWTSMAAGLIGARLSFFARNTGAFSGELTSIFSLNLNLFDPIGGLLIALAVSIYIISKSGIPILNILDRLSPFFSIFLGALHFSNFAAGKGYGSLSQIPWAINLWGATRHPVQLYYLLGSLIGFGVILFLLRNSTYAQGVIFFVFVLITSVYMLFFSRYESYANQFIFGFRLNQIIFWFTTLFSLIFLNKQSPSIRQALIHETKK